MKSVIHSQEKEFIAEFMENEYFPESISSYLLELDDHFSTIIGRITRLSIEEFVGHYKKGAKYTGKMLLGTDEAASLIQNRAFQHKLYQDLNETVIYDDSQSLVDYSIKVTNDFGICFHKNHTMVG